MIKFEISPSGDSVKVKEVTGHGEDCTEFTRGIERRLGSVDEESRELTDEYFECQELEGDIEL